MSWWINVAGDVRATRILVGARKALVVLASISGAVQCLRGDRRGVDRDGETRVEGKMRDRRGKFGLAQTIVHGAAKMGGELIRAIQRGQGRDRHQAAIPLRESWIRPHRVE